MKVSELIEKLKNFDQDATVLNKNLKMVDDAYEKSVGNYEINLLEEIDVKFRKAVIIV